MGRRAALTLPLALPLALALLSTSHAATINVGGDPGWIIQAYTDITAQVGDVLNFTYTPDPKTYHDIWDMKTVDAYTACLFTDAQFLHNLTDFLYTLEAPGTRYFACSAQGFHCAIGQKVTVNVLPGSGPAPRPKPAKSPPKATAPLPSAAPAPAPVAPSPVEAPPTLQAPPPSAGQVINVGGDEGWVAKEYDPITVYVGDTLNFTAGTTEEGRFVVAGMGNQDNFDECNFTGKGVRNLGFEALLTYKKAGTRYYSSPGLGGSLCREGLMKLEVDVLPASERPPADAPSEAPPSESPPPALAPGPSAGVPSTVSPGDGNGSSMINVGGDDGWVIQQYAPIKMKPGDTLNFTWDKERGKLEGGNDVWDMKTADAFNSCNFTNAQFIGINSVFVQLTNESDFYFACSIGDGGHCRAGQKVKVSLSVPAPPPEPDDTLGSTRSRQPLHGLLLLATVLFTSAATAGLSLMM